MYKISTYILIPYLQQLFDKLSKNIFRQKMYVLTNIIILFLLSEKINEYLSEMYYFRTVNMEVKWNTLFVHLIIMYIFTILKTYSLLMLG